MIEKIETGFFIPINRQEPIYKLVDDTDQMLAVIYRTYRLKKNTIASYTIKIEYKIKLNNLRKFSKTEISMIRIYYDNLVNTLTRDIQTIFTDNLEDRMNLPFYRYIIHIKTL